MSCFGRARNCSPSKKSAGSCRCACSLGVRKVRLTGGEPLVRTELPRLVNMLSELAELDDLALTTNGILLAEQAADLRSAGLRRLNVSLDTLREERFRQLTRRSGVQRRIGRYPSAPSAWGLTMSA